MSLSQTDRDQRDEALFGISTEALRDIVESAVRNPPYIEGDVTLALGILSDAQECLDNGWDTRARQYINRAKYVLNYYVLDRE
jgi:hypothetical protein